MNWKKGIVFVFLLSGLVSCGADKLKKTTTTEQSNLSAGQSCNCNSSYSPVCGIDGKVYDNSCIAQCFGTSVKNPGFCECAKNTTLVCGADGANYTECEANAQKIEIVKYIPCEARGL